MFESFAYRVARRLLKESIRPPTATRRLRTGALRLVLPCLPYRRLRGAPRRFPAGAISVTGHSRILVAPGSEAFLNITGGIQPFLEHAKSFYFQEELGSTLARCPNGRRVYLRPLESPVRLPGAWVSVCHPSSWNWMHWMSECVPAIAAACADPALAGCGIIHDVDLPESAIRTLEILAGDRRRVAIESCASVTPDQLHAIPGVAGGWCFAWPRGAATKGPFSFDAEALQLARQRILGHLRIQPRRTRRLFVRRQSAFRVMHDQDRLARLLESDGFEAVDPGSLEFGEQVRSFAECDMVVAQAGAALGNIMFMPEGSTVVCLHAESRYVNQDYFSDYAATFGVGVRYVAGPIDDERNYDPRLIADARHPMNASFRVDPHDVRRVVATAGHADGLCSTCGSSPTSPG